MDVEFHYYVTYIIARFARLDDKFAYRVAYSSQYVDDNYFARRVVCPNSFCEYHNNASAVALPLNNEAWKILLRHHFLPGDCKDPLITTADSQIAQRLLGWAVETGDPYLIGIATHAYADTWAHQNFKGIRHSYNDSGRFEGNFVPSIGHADFGIVPDAVGVYWYDSRFGLPIDNNKRFMQAALRIFDHLAVLSDMSKPEMKNERLNLSHALAMLMRKSSRYSFIDHELKQRMRIRSYLNYIRQKFQAEPGYYDDKEWINKAISRERWDSFWKPEHESSDWYQFQEAVKSYSSFFENWANANSQKYLIPVPS